MQNHADVLSGAYADDLPGADLVRAGLADLRAGRESEAALLVEIAAPRLRTLGFDIPEARASSRGEQQPPEHRLYELLARAQDGGAHSRYNALLGRIASFARAAEHAPQR